MLQTAFQLSCMNQASAFEWHKRFKESRESARDDERCGRSKEVRTPELIGQVKNFMDKDRHVSIETITAQFDVSVGNVHTIIREEIKIQKICVKLVPRMLREDKKERRCHDSREMVKLINSDSMVLDALMTCDESWIYCYYPETKKQSCQWKHAGSPRPKKARQSKSTNKLLMVPFFFDSTGMIYMHWVPAGLTVNKEYYVEVLRLFRKRFRRKRPALFKSGQRHFHQDNALVRNSIPVTDYLTKMVIKTVPHRPYSPDLAPCDIWLFPNLKENLTGYRYETIEEISVMRQLRGLAFHVCTINKSAHTKKVWKLIVCFLYHCYYFAYGSLFSKSNQDWKYFCRGKYLYLSVLREFELFKRFCKATTAV